MIDNDEETQRKIARKVALALWERRDDDYAMKDNWVKMLQSLGPASVWNNQDELH